jgi:hypothetical protein
MASVGRDYRAAVALNNIGISLLEQSCFEQAYETMQDALIIMKKVCVEDETSPLTMADLDFKLKLADERYANPRPNNYSEAPFFFKSVSDDPSATEIDLMLHEHQQTDQCVYAIRLESMNLESCSIPDPFFYCSIILLNFGSAHLCKAWPYRENGAKCIGIFRHFLWINSRSPHSYLDTAGFIFLIGLAPFPTCTFVERRQKAKGNSKIALKGSMS